MIRLNKIFVSGKTEFVNMNGVSYERLPQLAF